MLQSTEARHIMEAPAIHRAVQVLKNPVSLARRQRDDPHLGQVRKSLYGTVIAVQAPGEVDRTGYGLDNNDIIRYVEEKGGKLPANPYQWCLMYPLWCTPWSRSYSGLGARSVSLAFGYPRYATIHVIVRVPGAHETEKQTGRNIARTPARTVG